MAFYRCNEFPGLYRRRDRRVTFCACAGPVSFPMTALITDYKSVSLLPFQYRWFEQTYPENRSKPPIDTYTRLGFAEGWREFFRHVLRVPAST